MFIIFGALIVPLLLLVYLAWRWPERAVCLVVALMPTYLLRTSLFDIPTNTFELAVIVVFAISALRPDTRSRWSLAARQLPWPAWLLVGLFVLSAIISTTISNVPYVSLGILKSWILIPILLSWLVWVFCQRSSDPQLDPASLLSPVVSALIASGTVVAVASFFFFKPDQRLAGIYDVPNSLALFLAPIIVLALAGAVTNSNKYRLLLAGMVMFVALILTQSVAGLASVLLVLSGAGLISWRRQFQYAAPQFGAVADPPAVTLKYTKSRLLILSAILCLTVLSFGYLFQVGRLQYFLRPITDPSARTSLSVRLQLWDISWELIKQHSLLGVGLGQFEPYYQQALHDRFKHFEICTSPNLLTVKDCQFIIDQPPIAEWVFRDPHSWPLSFWLNMGILGLFSFTGLNIYVFWLILKRPDKKSPSSLVTHYSLLTILIFGLVDTIYWKNDLAALYWVLLSILLIESKFNFTDRAQPESAVDC